MCHSIVLQLVLLYIWIVYGLWSRLQGHPAVQTGFVGTVLSETLQLQTSSFKTLHHIASEVTLSFTTNGNYFILRRMTPTISKFECHQ